MSNDYTTDYDVDEMEPDWSCNWEPAQAELELSNFKFNGIGWYFSNGDSMLVTPTHMEGHFRFNVFNNRDARNKLNMLRNLVPERNESNNDYGS